MTASFCLVNLKGMEGLLSGVLRCWRTPSQFISCPGRCSAIDGLNWLRLVARAVGQHTTMRVSLGLFAVTESALCCGRATRDTDRTAVRITKGESLLAMAEC